MYEASQKEMEDDDIGKSKQNLKLSEPKPLKDYDFFNSRFYI